MFVKICFFILFLPSLFFAREKCLHGVVLDQQGNPVESAFISTDKNEEFTYSDENGRFTIPLIREDSLFVEHLGYQRFQLSLQKVKKDTLFIRLINQPVRMSPFLVTDYTARGKRLLPGKKRVLIIGQTVSAKSVTEVLKYVPDIQIIENGSGGGLKTISINGMGGGYVACKIEGMTINSAQNGGVDLSLIGNDEVEEIDVQYGGNAVDAGPSAFAGVINFSVLPATYKTMSEITIGGGSYSNYSLNVKKIVSFGNESGIKIGANFRSGKDDFIYKEQGNIKNIYNAMFSRWNTHAGGTLSLSKKLKLKWLTNFNNGYSQIPALNPYQKAEQRDQNGFGLLNFSFDLNQNHSISINTSGNRQNLNYINENLNIDDHYTNDRATASITHKFVSNDRRFKWNSNVELNYNKLNSTQILFREEEDLRLSIAASLGEKYFDQLFVTYSSGLSSTFTQYDSKFHNDIRIGAKAVLPGADAYATLQTGFKIPTFNDRYWPGAGNRDLKVEESLQAIVGVNVQLYNNFYASLDLTQYKTRDMIRWIPVDGVNWKPENVFEINGQTISLNLKMNSKWYDISGGVTIQKVESGGKLLRYIPKIMGAFKAEIIPIKGIQIFAGNRFSGDRPRLDGGFEHNYVIPGFVVFDLGISYLKSFYRISFKANNITDKTYFVQNEIPMKGKNYDLSIRFTF